MTDIDHEQGRRVLEALKRLHDELESIGKEGELLKRSPRADAQAGQERLRTIKEELKRLARNGTLDGARRELTELERCFFARDVQKAASRFRLRTDAHPSKWMSGTFEPMSDLSYAIFNLEKFLRKS